MDRLTTLFAVEWLRLHTRRDIRVLLLGFAAFIFLRQVLAFAAVATLNFPAGMEVPPELLAETERRLAGYSMPASIGTTFLDALPILFLFVGFLTCWAVGSEFSSGTVRTALVVNPNRVTYFVGRLIGSYVLAAIALVMTLLAGAALPFLGPTLGAPLDPKPWSIDPSLIWFLAASGLAIALPVTLAALVTGVVRSPTLSMAAFVAVVGAGMLVSALDLPPTMRILLPVNALSAIVEGTAPVGALIPSGGGGQLDPDHSARIVGAFAAAAWSLGFVLLGLRVFIRRDVTE
jgi:hypothetical protein